MYALVESAFRVIDMGRVVSISYIRFIYSSPDFEKCISVSVAT